MPKEASLKLILFVIVVTSKTLTHGATRKLARSVEGSSTFVLKKETTPHHLTLMSQFQGGPCHNWQNSFSTEICSCIFKMQLECVPLTGKKLIPCNSQGSLASSPNALVSSFKQWQEKVVSHGKPALYFDVYIH